MINSNSYSSCNGTSIRDYIHVWNLAQANLAASTYAEGSNQSKADKTIINICLDPGATVGEGTNAHLKVIGLTIPVRISKRRVGATAEAYADITRVRGLLNWQPKLHLTEGTQENLRWQHFWGQRD